MAFSVGMQAFLTDRFYVYLKERYPEQALDALMTGFNYYAIQRGHRAAQRAVRDKVPLNFENYQKYREVVATEEMKQREKKGRSEHILNEQEYVGVVYECPGGHDVFRELNSPDEVEQLFCLHIDKCNVYRFSSDIPYEVVSTLCNSSCCIHRSQHPGCSPDTTLGIRMPDAPPFPFIVANEFFTIKRTLEAIFGKKDAEDIAEQVRRDFVARYGEEDWNEVRQYENADFNLMYPKGLPD